MKKVFLFILVLGIFISCKNSMSGKFSLTDGKEPFTLNQNMVSRLAAFAVTGNCKLDEQQVEDNVLSALSALSENGNERAAVTVKDFSLSAPKVATLKAPATFGKTERSANIQDFDDINLYLYSTNEGKDNEGWVLASNDRRVGTIIAVVDGKYSEDDEMENGNESEVSFMDIFYAGLEEHILETVYTWNSLTEEDIRAALSNTEIVTSGKYTYNNWKMYDKYGEPMRFVGWHQDSPFANAVRVMKNNPYYIAGCGPVALAQIFTYHEWPERCSEVQYRELKQKWGAAKNWDGVYDWTVLGEGYVEDGYFDWLSDDDISDFKINAGALLYDIGVYSHAEYEIKLDNEGNLILNKEGAPIAQTGINITGAKDALTHYGYVYDDVCDYNDKTHKILVDSLRHNCPLYFRGSALQERYPNGKWYSTGGHAWVVSACLTLSCDVFDGSTKIAQINDDFLYCIPGWKKTEAGICFNGYYLANAFDFRDRHRVSDWESLISAERDWYIRKKIEQHERAATAKRGESKYYQFDVKMIPNIRPEEDD